jgi:thiamine transporter ThiT
MMNGFLVFVSTLYLSQCFLLDNTTLFLDTSLGVSSLGVSSLDVSSVHFERKNIDFLPTYTDFLFIFSIELIIFVMFACTCLRVSYQINDATGCALGILLSMMCGTTFLLSNSAICLRYKYNDDFHSYMSHCVEYRNVVELAKTRIETPELAYYFIKKNHTFAQYVPDYLWGESLVDVAIRKNSETITYIPQRFLTKEVVTRACVLGFGDYTTNFQVCNREMIKYPELIQMYVMKHPFTFHYFNPKIDFSNDFKLKFIQRNPYMCDFFVLSEELCRAYFTAPIIHTAVCMKRCLYKF